MDDALLVRGGKRLGHGPADRGNPLRRQPPFRDRPVQRLPLDQLHGQEVDAVGFVDGMDRDDVRVVEGGDGAGLALETGEALRVVGEVRGQHLEGDLAPELRVDGAIDLAHAARAERGDDLVVTETGARGEGHGVTTVRFAISRAARDASARRPS